MLNDFPGAVLLRLGCSEGCRARVGGNCSRQGLVLATIAPSCSARGSLSSRKAPGLSARAGEVPRIAGYSCFKRRGEPGRSSLCCVLFYPSVEGMCLPSPQAPQAASAGEQKGGLAARSKMR